MVDTPPFRSLPAQVLALAVAALSPQDLLTWDLSMVGKVVGKFFLKES